MTPGCLSRQSSAPAALPLLDDHGHTRLHDGNTLIAGVVAHNKSGSSRQRRPGDTAPSHSPGILVGDMRTPLIFLPTAVAVSLLLGGCIGARDHSDILDEAARRGAGAEPFVVREAVEAVAAKVSAEPDQLLVASISIHPQRVSLEAADPRTPGNWDRYQYRDGRVADSDPINVEHREPAGFLLGDFRALDRLPELVADAGRQAGLTGGRQGSMTISAKVDHGTGDVSGPVLSIFYPNERRSSARYEYDADGNLL